MQHWQCHRLVGASQVGYSAVVFYGYVGLIGLALWAMMKWWFKSDVSLPQVWCTYGACSAGKAALAITSSLGSGSSPAQPDGMLQQLHHTYTLQPRPDPGDCPQ